MHIKTFLLILSLTTGIPSLTSAQSKNLSKEFDSCMNRSGGVTIGMIECMVQETEKQDARLNREYKKIMSQLSDERKKTLLVAQRAWIRYRDSNCAFYADPEGGTMARVLANSCVMSMTAERADEITSINN